MKGRDKVRTGLDFGRRGGVILPWICTILFLATEAMAQTTNGLSGAEIQGRQLARQLCEMRPAENFTNTGVLEIRDGKGGRADVPVQCETVVTGTNWFSVYAAGLSDVKIVHAGAEENEYHYHAPNGKTVNLPGSRTMFPFANSDFWIGDLGLEFFHWPEQKLLRKEVKRSRGCAVLESTDPNPSTNGYSRVVSWIDGESGGIVQAWAYDTHGKLLKEFYPKDLKKVGGQWQVESMEIRNDQTGSRTRLEFDLNKR